MHFSTLVNKRYSCRSFLPKPVEPAKYEELLDLCLKAPTAHNNWPLQLHVIESTEKQEVIRAATRYHFSAPLFILICYDREKVWVRREDAAHSGIDDAAIVGCHLMLGVQTLGLGTTWVKAFNPATLSEGLNLTENIVPVCLFPIGYPSETAAPAPAHFIRPEKETVVIYE